MSSKDVTQQTRAAVLRMQNPQTDFSASAGTSHGRRLTRRIQEPHGLETWLCTGIQGGGGHLPMFVFGEGWGGRKKLALAKCMLVIQWSSVGTRLGK